MDSVESLCKFLIYCALRRCRLLDDVCRLSVSLTPAPPLVRFSVSDTGIGSTLEEFQTFKCSNNPFFMNKWGKTFFTPGCVVQKSTLVIEELIRSYGDGILCVVTTSISDKEIHLLKYDMKEVEASKRLVRLPSMTKIGANYSGTEVSLSLFEENGSLVIMLSEVIRKMLILKTAIAAEFSVIAGGNEESGCKSIILQGACSDMPMDTTNNIEQLKLAFLDYVSKHGNRLIEACQSCFSTGKDPKVGAGIACSPYRKRCGEQVMEVVIIISELSIPAQPSCLDLCSQKTEVLYFRDFSHCSISQSCLEALSSFDWKKYGLALKSFEDQDGATLVEWENLPPGVHIDIVLHRYSEQALMQPLARKNTRDKYLTTRAVKLALNDLKEKSGEVLLSQHAAKICSYAPDLAKTISGLILSSEDKKFQEDCLSLLGLKLDENASDAVEKCIKDKITDVVTRNDRYPRAAIVAPLLFKEPSSHGPEHGDHCHEGAMELWHP
ncbi:type 2 DNA topoisomerase 6 subunit B-like isoform X2 [Andrographis paniculata]|uniref:type 2 DNA topoisomerase 6 subunit B-like isoform X2 n=1 Tax=Andrographis paniculata TaxID=175694 RepID=UPI0021E842DC|nr:type 2 DNA topoisomerase 6 subunit B-like isoform X2 [Andrographis paniculata]